MALGPLLPGGVAPPPDERTAAIMFWFGSSVVVNTLAPARRSHMVIALIFDDCRSSIEMVLGNPVTKASLVSFSISTSSNPANPISCLILFANTST